MKQKITSTTYLLFIPVITFVFCTYLALFINNSYFIDPGYAYLINGLNIIRGESYSIIHIDHPGTPLQVFIGIIITITGTLRGADNFTSDVLRNPQLYIKAIIVSIAFFHSIVLFFIGKRYFKYRNDLPNTLLIQFSFLLFATVMANSTRIVSETIIPLGSLLIILITIEKVWGKMNYITYSILSGLILGVFSAIKITFLPVAIIPVIIVKKWRNKVLIPIIAGISFFVSVLPVIKRFVLFESFISKVATHDGLYGSGQEETVNISKILKNIYELFNYEYTFTLIFALAFITLVIVFRKNKFHFLKDKNIRILFALFLSFVLQLLMVSKHIGFRYMVPALMFSAFALSIVTNRMKSHKIVSYSILVLILFSSVFYNIKMLTEAVELNRSQNKTFSFVENNITPDDALLVMTKNSWTGSPFKSHSLMYGKLYCSKQGEQYNDILQSIYPKRFFLKHNNKQITNWHMAVMPDLLLNENKYLYIYTQTDNPEKNFSSNNKFTKYLKYYDEKSIEMKLFFSNPDTNEDIYLLHLKSPKTITPKLTIFSDFEKRDEENENLLLTSYDSIFINEGLRLTDYTAFGGKYSICIKPDNPFGMRVVIPNTEQNDFIHISIMCKRSSKREDCIIALKSLSPDEDFSTLGGVSTELINGWENIEYSYRFNHTPAGQKVVMYIWSSSNEPMYFDNLKIELY